MGRTQSRVCNSCKSVSDYWVGKSPMAIRLNRGPENLDPNPDCRNCGEPTEPWDRTCPTCSCEMKPDGPGVFAD